MLTLFLQFFCTLVLAFCATVAALELRAFHRRGMARVRRAQVTVVTPDPTALDRAIRDTFRDHGAA